IKPLDAKKPAIVPVHSCVSQGCSHVPLRKTLIVIKNNPRVAGLKSVDFSKHGAGTDVRLQHPESAVRLYDKPDMHAEPRAPAGSDSTRPGLYFFKTALLPNFTGCHGQACFI